MFNQLSLQRYFGKYLISTGASLREDASLGKGTSNPSKRSNIEGQLFRRLLAMCMLSTVVLTTGCQTTSSDSSLPVSNPTARQTAVINSTSNALRVGETVDVFVLEDESFTGRYKIRDTGVIILPKVGRIAIGGKSIQEAERLVRSRLEQDQLKKASVVLERSGLEPSSSSAIASASGEAIVFVTGNVNRPGRVTLPDFGGSVPTVLQAIVDAGGFARFANEKKVLILRKDADSGATKRIYVNVANIQRGQQADFPVASGDVIVVEERAFGF